MTHPGSGGAIWEIRKRGSAFSKVDVERQRVVLLARLLERFPGGMLRWKGTPPAPGNSSDAEAFKHRAPHTWAIPKDATAEKLHALIAPGEWLIYATPKRTAIADEHLDVWGDLRRTLVLSTVPDFFIGARAGDDPWIFWIRPGLGG